MEKERSVTGNLWEPDVAFINTRSIYANKEDPFGRLNKSVVVDVRRSELCCSITEKAYRWRRYIDLF